MVYLSQNFPTAVALSRHRVSDYPGHLRGRTALIRFLPAGLARPLRRLTHAVAAVVGLWGPAVSLYFHQRCFQWSRTQNAARRVRLRGFIPWQPPHPAVCSPPSDVTVRNERSASYRLPCMYIGDDDDGTDMKLICGCCYWIVCKDLYDYSLPSTTTITQRVLWFICFINESMQVMDFKHFGAKHKSRRLKSDACGR